MDNFPYKFTKRMHNYTIIALFCLFVFLVFSFFFVTKISGIGPLFKRVNVADIDLLVTRRFIGLLLWITFDALTFYLGVTEIGPKLLKPRKAHQGVWMIHYSIMLNYVIGLIYTVYLVTVISLSDSFYNKIIKSMYLAELATTFFGLLFYLGFVFWIPQVLHAKNILSYRPPRPLKKSKLQP